MTGTNTSPNMSQPTMWFDEPNPNPKRRRPMAELLVELAERNGDPVWPVELMHDRMFVHPRKAVQ